MHTPFGLRGMENLKIDVSEWITVYDTVNLLMTYFSGLEPEARVSDLVSAGLRIFCEIWYVAP